MTITSVAYGGGGVGRHQGKVVFVPGALPGETVRAEIVQDRRNYARGRLLGLVGAPSPSRVEPVCPLVAQGCPGCCYQHVRYESEVRLKHQQLEEFMGRQIGAGGLLLPPTPSGSDYGYRNKVALHASPEGGRTVLGYYLEDNRTVLDVPQCPLAAPPINELLAGLRTKRGFLDGLRADASVTLRYNLRDGAVWWIGKAEARAIWLREDTCVGPVSVPRGSFFQVNPEVADRVVGWVKELVERSASAAVVDLYAGVGVFALAAVQAGKPRVFAVDSDEQAIKAAEYNMKQAGGTATLVQGDAGRALPDVLRATEPAATLVILDPPRAGLQPRVLATLAARRPAEIVYVSCAVDTMARDVTKLVASGYAVQSSRLFDMFPRTPLFETVVHLAWEA